MVDVEFHTGVTEPVAFACRLLRKAYRQGARVLVTAPADVVTALDRALWVFDERDFVPHVRVPAAAADARSRTPIWLALDAAAAAGLADAPRLLVNIGADAPVDAAALQRLIEIVPADPDAAHGGRARWRAYQAAGMNITHHGAAADRG